jgi:CRISPR-associated protein Cas6
MFWQEDEDKTELSIPDDVVDVLFSLQCRSIAVDHAHALSQALLATASWLSEPDIAIHSIHVAGSQNGWERPEHGSAQQLQLSRRTKLCIRLPRTRVAALKAALEGQRLNVGGSALQIRDGKERPLSRAEHALARYVAGPAGLEEEQFLHWAADELKRRGLRMRKAMSGKTTPLTTPAGPIETRSLMIADLKPDESILLQQHGLGPHQDMGCGIFVPHKGIDAVHKAK